MAIDQDAKGKIPLPEGVTTLKKMIHSGVERRRRKRLCELIDKACNLMPTQFDLGPKAPRTSLLERLYLYIVDLRNKNDALMFANPQSVLVQEITSLRKRIQELERLNGTYINLLNKAGITTRECLDSSLVSQWQGKNLKYSKSGRDNKRDNDEEDDIDEGEEEVESKTIGASQLVELKCGPSVPLSIQPSGAPIVLLTQPSQGLATSNGMIIPIIVTGNADGSTVIHKQTPSVNLVSNSCDISPKVQKNSVTVNKGKGEPRKAKVAAKSKLTTTIEELGKEEESDQPKDQSKKTTPRMTRQSARNKKAKTFNADDDENILHDTSHDDAKKIKRKTEFKNSSSKRTKRSNSGPSQINLEQIDIQPQTSTQAIDEDISEKVPEVTKEVSSKVGQNESEKTSERSPSKMSSSFETNTNQVEGKNSFSYYATSLLHSNPTASSDNDGQTQKSSADTSNEPSQLKNDKESRNNLGFNTEDIHRFTTKDSEIVSDVTGASTAKDSESEPPSDGKQRGLYLANTFELDSYTNIFGELSTTPNDTRLTPTPLVTSHLAASGSKSTSFEMSFTSTAPAIASTASSFFTPVSSQTEASSYSNGVFAQPHTSHHPHQTPFPPFLLTDHSLAGSPHKGSSTTSSSLFPLPDFNAPATFSPIFDSNTQADQELHGYPRKVSNSSSNTRSKKSSGSGNTSTTKTTGRKTQSKKATSTTATSSTENSLFFPAANSKRQNADNFLIPGIISPVPSNTSVNFTPNPPSDQSNRYFFGQVPTDQSYGSNNTTSRNYDIEIFSSKSSQRTGQCSDSVNEEIQQPSSNPIRSYSIFRPQNVSSSSSGTSSEPTPSIVTNSSPSTTSANISSTSVYLSRANLPNSMSYYPTSTSTVSSSTTTGSTGHIPNFNLSNIFPDITLSTSTAMTGTYQYPYLSSSSVDFNTGSKSTNYSARFNQPVTGSSGQSSSGFLPKLPPILVPKSSVETLTVSNDPKTVAASLYGHSHHHHSSHQNSSSAHHTPHAANYPSNPFYTHTAPQHNFVASNGNSSGESVSTISPMSIGRIRHNITSSGTSSHFSGCDSDLTSMNSNTSHSNRANYHHLVPPGSVETGHANGSQNSLQSFSLYPTSHIQSGASNSDSARMTSGESSGLANSVSHGHAFNPHACHHSTGAPSTLGSFGRANSASSNVVHNTHPAPPHPIPFPLFGLSTRTEL